MKDEGTLIKYNFLTWNPFPFGIYHRYKEIHNDEKKGIKSNVDRIVGKSTEPHIVLCSKPWIPNIHSFRVIQKYFKCCHI